MKEIERKFLVREIPDLKDIKPIRYERYFIQNTELQQIRVQKRGNVFEKEIKKKINTFEYEKYKEIITEEEFSKIASKCKKSIIRDSYLISNNPNITIKKYFGEYEGLIRAEIEFNNIDELNVFEIPKWIGKEITGTILGNDNKLIKLDRNKFLQIMQEIKNDY